MAQLASVVPCIFVLHFAFCILTFPMRSIRQVAEDSGSTRAAVARANNAPKSIGTYLITLRPKTRYAAVQDAINKIPHIGAMLIKTDVTDILTS